MSSSRLLLPVVLASAWCSCVGTDVGNPPSDDDRTVISRLAFDTYSDGDVAEGDDDAESGMNGDRDQETTRVTPNGLTLASGADLDEVWLVVESITVSVGAVCDGTEEERTIEGPFFVDLGRGTVVPEEPILSDRAEEFCAIHLEVAPKKDVPDTVPAELAGRSVWFEGIDAKGASVSLRTARTLRLEYLGDRFAVEAGATNDVRFIAAFEHANWLDGFEGREGPSDLDDVRDGSAISTFLTTLRQDSRIVRDNDDDGRVNAREFSTPVGVPRTP